MMYRHVALLALASCVNGVGKEEKSVDSPSSPDSDVDTEGRETDSPTPEDSDNAARETDPEVETDADAESAIKEWNGSALNGRNLFVEKAQERAPGAPRAVTSAAMPALVAPTPTPPPRAVVAHDVPAEAPTVTGSKRAMFNARRLILA